MAQIFIILYLIPEGRWAVETWERRRAENQREAEDRLNSGAWRLERGGEQRLERKVIIFRVLIYDCFVVNLLAIWFFFYFFFSMSDFIITLKICSFGYQFVKYKHGWATNAGSAAPNWSTDAILTASKGRHDCMCDGIGGCFASMFACARASSYWPFSTPFSSELVIHFLLRIFCVLLWILETVILRIFAR